MDVGVRRLKMHLSEFLERAANGEVIRVTERGKPKALLGPFPGHADLSVGVNEGWIKLGNGSAPAPSRRQVAAQALLDTLAQDREDR